MRKVLVISLLLCALSSCGVFSNPQDKQPNPTPTPHSESGILVDLHNFDAYVGKQVDIRLVGNDGTVLSVTRLTSLTSGDYRLELVSVPKKPENYVDVMIDANGDGVYEPDSEPGWSQPLNSNGSVAFRGTDTPSGVPTPENPGGDFVMHFTGFGALQDKLLRLAMLNPANQITGLYTGTVEGDEFAVTLPQIVVNSEPYTVALFADTNGNGHYDAPPVDAAWYAYATGDANGINFVFPYNEDFEDVDFEQ